MAETTTALMETMKTSFTSVANDSLDVIAAMVPIALSVIGACMVVGFGIKIFKRLTGKA